MPARLWVSRSPTPEMSLPARFANPPRASDQVSDTWHPVGVALKAYVQVATPIGPAVTLNAKRAPRSHSVISQSVLHDFLPRAFLPLNRAPTAGAVAPLTHSPPVASGDHSPMRVMSLIMSQTFSAGAAMSRSTVISLMGRNVAGE